LCCFAIDEGVGTSEGLDVKDGVSGAGLLDSLADLCGFDLSYFEATDTPAPGT